METVKLDDPNCNLTETSPMQLLPPDSPDINDIFGEPQLSVRIGDEYQAEIFSMITGSEHFRLLIDPLDSEGSPYLAHSFLLGLPVPVTWTPEQDIDFEDECKGGSSKPGDGAKVDESVKSRKCRKGGQNSKRKRNSELNAEKSDSKFSIEKESNSENLECGLASKTKLFRPFEGKSSHLIPGSTSDAWSNAEVDSFLLGLYVFGKDFGKIKRFIENKKMGDILSFYYGAFYRSDRYRRWSDGHKRGSRRKVYGRKIFTGWRQQEFFSRLVTDIPDELRKTLQEVSKSFVEGRISLENYVFNLKTTVGVCALIEAVGIGKGKTDLTGLAMEPPRTSLVSPEIPSVKDFSSLTSVDIIRFLTGGSRLSKARCNDIFWEAVWPRLLARGWHSEQPKDQCSVSSKHYLLFLMPGVKKFSRRKLVKGNHYFDSVSDVLSKVASEPALIELDAEGNGIRTCNEEDGCIPDDSSDQDDPPYRKTCYLKPRVSIFSSNHMKFTIVDSSLAHGGKASKMRELRCSPVDLRFISKPVPKDTQDSRQVKTNHMLSKDNKGVSNSRQCEGIITRSNARHVKFTIVDTSLLHGGKSPRVRGLRYLPFKFKTSSEINNSSGGSEDNNAIDDSPDEHEHKISDKLSNSSGSTDTKPSNEPVTTDNLLKVDENHRESKYDDSSNRNQKNSCTADQGSLVHQDKKTNTSEDTRSNRIIKLHFSRRGKSCHSVGFVPVEKRRKLIASANTESSSLTENFTALSISLANPRKQQRLTGTENNSSDPVDLFSPTKRQRLNACTETEEGCLGEKLSTNISEQMELCRALKSQDESSNGVLRASRYLEKVSSLSSSTAGNPESETPHGSGGKLQSRSSIGSSPPMLPPNTQKAEQGITGSSPPMLPPNTQKGEQGITEAVGSKFINVNAYGDASETATSIAQEQQHVEDTRRQSKRSRPLTTRVLEAFESGFFNMKRTPKVRDVQTQAILFSCPSRKACSRTKPKPKPKPKPKQGTADSQSEDAKEGNGKKDGAFICSIGNPPQVAQ